MEERIQDWPSNCPTRNAQTTLTITVSNNTHKQGGGGPEISVESWLFEVKVMKTTQTQKLLKTQDSDKPTGKLPEVLQTSLNGISRIFGVKTAIAVSSVKVLALRLRHRIVIAQGPGEAHVADFDLKAAKRRRDEMADGRRIATSKARN